MSEMQELLVEPFRRLLADIVTPGAVRAAEAAPSAQLAIWDQIVASGFLDALVAEDDGGAGLTLADAFPLVAAAGEFLLPAPFGETMVARAILSHHGERAPAGAAIILAAPSLTHPGVSFASHALVAAEDALHLVAIEEISADPFGCGGGQVSRIGEPIVTVPRGANDLAVCAAALTGARMAGMARRLLDMSIGYVEQRQQFGRALSKFQAIQQQLAVFAEQVVSMHVAARIGMSGLWFDPVRAAMSKARVGEASHLVAGIAHAVHGAIGVTEEYDLQLVTRRLKQGQLAFGTESHWALLLGRACLESGLEGGADFVRTRLQDAEISL